MPATAVSPMPKCNDSTRSKCHMTCIWERLGNLVLFQKEYRDCMDILHEKEKKESPFKQYPVSFVKIDSKCSQTKHNAFPTP